MDNIIVAVIMVVLIISFIVGAIIAHKKGNVGFAASARYDERVGKNKDKPKKEVE